MCGVRDNRTDKGGVSFRSKETAPEGEKRSKIMPTATDDQKRVFFPMGQEQPSTST